MPVRYRDRAELSGITLNELRGLVDGNDEEFKKLLRPVRHHT